MSSNPKYPSVDPGYKPSPRGGSKSKQMKEDRALRRPPPIDSGLTAPPLPELYVEPRIKGHISLWSRRAVTMELTDEEMEFHGVQRRPTPRNKDEGMNSEMIGYGESTGMPAPDIKDGRSKWDHLRDEALRLRRKERMSTHAIVRELDGPSRTLVGRWLRQEGLNFDRSEAQTAKKPERVCRSCGGEAAPVSEKLGLQCWPCKRRESRARQRERFNLPAEGLPEKDAAARRRALRARRAGKSIDDIAKFLEIDRAVIAEWVQHIEVKS